MSEHLELERRLVASSPDAVLVSRGGRIVFVNPAAVRLLGASVPEQTLGTGLLDVLDHASQERLSAQLTEWLNGRAAAAVEAQIVRPDGTTTYVELTGTRLPSENDEEEAALILARDITERKRADAALREREERLTLAFAGAREGVWDWNLETGAVIYSSRWKQMLGYSDEEIEPHVSAWERLLHPDDRARARQVNETVMRGERDYQMEVRLRHKDGRYVDVLSRGYPVRRNAGGPVVRIVGTHLDLTERKRAEAALRDSEERLSLAFAAAQEGVWDWNLETGAVVYSPRWSQMLGYTEEEVEPDISAWERLLHPDDLERARRLNEAVARGEAAYEGEFRLRHKNGHYVPVLSRGILVRREPGGPIVRIVGTHFDLTERKRSETERARTELLARLVFAQEDERRRIARDMHDQFGELLTVLAHKLRWLKNACGEESDLVEHVDALEQVARQLDRNVDLMVWELRPTALDDLGLRAALANYVHEWSTRVGIPAELHTSGLTDERLAADMETTLYRIAQEALTNVAKHSRAKRVDVILERRADQVLLIVEDDGVGFEAGEADALDARFGLLGMQERAALVGASLQIESAAGKGTTILVRMTAAAASSADGNG